MTIRVIMRHIDDADGRLLGDFPPTEIGPLLDVLADTRIYWSDDHDDCALVKDQLPSDCLQLVDDARGARMILEVLVE